MRTSSFAALAVIASALSACGGAEETSSEWPEPDHPAVEPIRAPSAARFWPTHDYVEMIPPVRLPTTHDRRDRTQIWLKMPDGGVIETRWLDDQERWTISLPPGSRIDRVESLRYQRDDGQQDWTVVDVRGAYLSEAPVSVHVCRPTSGQPRVPLVGYSWPRAHPEAQRHATALLVDMLRDTRVPIDHPPMSGDALDRFVTNNECGRCHRPNLSTHTEDRDGLPHRATDADGCYVPLTVLQAAAAISEARPVDLNADDPYVAIRCADGSEPVRDGASLGCGDGSVPMARRDVARGMAEGDRYTERVCASRRYLYRHIDAAGRSAFAEGFEACGLR